MNQTKLTELGLLVLAGLVLLNGYLAVTLTNNQFDFQGLGVIACLIFLWTTTALVIRRSSTNADPLLLPLAVLLASIGLTIILRLRPDLFFPQSLWLIAGLIAFNATAFVFRQAEVIAKYKYLCGLTGIVLLLITITFGVDIGGNKNWVILGPLRFQPSEFAKLFIIIFLAAYLSERRQLLTFATRHYGPVTLPHPRFIAPLLALWGLTMAMLIVQRDLGSALLYFGTTVTMAYMASGRLSYVVLALGLFFIGSTVCYLLFPHVQVRIDIWLNPWADPTGRAYQIVQSLFAFGSGGILGSGLTFGYPNTIPEVHTDFIFAAIGEELGLSGTAAVIIAYILIVYRAFRTALTSPTPFTMLLSGGLAVLTALQVFLIIGGVTKFLPLTGITLPLISYGGSSMVSSFILLGMLFAISEATAPNEK
ncbi:FtsW/RodA/SpoVE family cell cycle protein [Sporomusa malonica]|uniref:Cell division protein FtsW, lipid II flippase n=1 Tax=Sporomusa malonica TaxID=112901 RepID=A0A1W2A5J9_9FIRM|nr:FtsW/RodA/SpoVE family cell cycle protein [Sporomusa malonica]SMC55965.1 cell division protein FtsW, lipid II flippase [Sporomusa malonica]